MMMDMATPYDELPVQDSRFAQMRDSLYILSVMNQCKFNWCPKFAFLLIAQALQIWSSETWSMRTKL